MNTKPKARMPVNNQNNQGKNKSKCHKPNNQQNKNINKNNAMNVIHQEREREETIELPGLSQ